MNNLFPSGPAGSVRTRLVVLRGPSGAGKTTSALAVRARLGRGVAVVGQDVLRRQILREHDLPGGVNIGLVSTVCRYSLDAGYDVILEGILNARRYGPMLRTLISDHCGRTNVYYFDVPFAETVRRHSVRPQVTEFTPQDMHRWYVAGDLLGAPGEQIITADSGLDETVDRIVAALENGVGNKRFGDG